MSGFPSADGQQAAASTVAFFVRGLTFDPAGLLVFVDDDRIRRVRTDGTLETIAGQTVGGFKDGTVAEALFSDPEGLAFDSTGALYVGDVANRRLRKVAAGVVSTVAGGGSVNMPTGSAKTTPIGQPRGVVVDSADNVYVFDYQNYLLYKVANDILTVVAGTSTFGTSDGPALSTYLPSLGTIGIDKNGAIYVVEFDYDRVVKVAGGNVTTFAGRLRFFGDGGPATSALLNHPTDMAIGPQGSLFIADEKNNRIRKVSADGKISTFAGNGFPRNRNAPAIDGKPATEVIIDEPTYIATDKQGNLYVPNQDAVKTRSLILKVNTAGILSVLAGNGEFISAGDGGLATAGSFVTLFDIAADGAGNVFVAESLSKVRKVSAAGIVSTFAGTGTGGITGDAGLATLATVSFPSKFATDAQGNFYMHNSILSPSAKAFRRVTTDGIINSYQFPGAPFDSVSQVAFDAVGNTYVVGSSPTGLYKMSPSGAWQIIVSDPNFTTRDMEADANGDIYLLDQINSVVTKLVQNTPTGSTITGGNNQTGPAGLELPASLKVQLTGRAGVAPEGVAVNFAVTSGGATLSSATAKTDSTGTAFVRVRPTAAGPISITATVPGTNLPGAVFALTGQAGQVCTQAIPTISDVHSLSEWGNFTRFASGSYLEIKGTNLSQTTRLWGGADFQGSNAPTTMDGVSVAINGNAAFTYYISPGQLNVQAPGDAAIGTVQITASNCAGTSAPFTMQKAAIAPGLLAPGSFNVGGKQYLVALFPGGTTFVGRPNLIPGASFREAKPGDSITAYGIGFGDTTPATFPGVIVAGQNSIPGLTIAFGSTPAVASYQGLAPGTVGLYQFDFTVPDVPDGDHEIVVKVGATQVAQTLFLTVKR